MEHNKAKWHTIGGKWNRDIIIAKPVPVYYTIESLIMPPTKTLNH